MFIIWEVQEAKEKCDQLQYPHVREFEYALREGQLYDRMIVEPINTSSHMGRLQDRYVAEFWEGGLD